MRWLASSALAVVLAAALWWLLTPSHDRAELGMAPVPDTATSVPGPATAQAPLHTPASAAAGLVPPLTPAELWDPIPDDELLAAREQAAKLRVAREAKALAAREQAALAEQDAARQYTDDAGVRVPAPAPPAAGPVPRSATPAPAPAPATPPARAGTVQETCGNRHPISQAICESRECGRAEHANEAICKRVRAAEERRQQPE